MTQAAPQRDHSLRELFNVLRYVIRYGIAWRAMPNDLPPWAEQLKVRFATVLDVRPTRFEDAC